MAAPAAPSLIVASSIPRDRSQVNLVLDRTRYTMDTYGQYFGTLRKFHRNYLSATRRNRGPEPNDVDTGGRDWHSDPFIPYSFGTIETALPRLVFSLFNLRPYVRMIGRGPEDHDRAPVATSVLDYDMERADVDYRSILAFKSFLKYGLTVGRVTWKRQLIEKTVTRMVTKPEFDQFGNIIGGKRERTRRKETIKKFDGPWFEPVSVFNFFPDPMAYEIEDMRYVVELKLDSLSRLKEEDEGYYDLTGEHLYHNLENLRGMTRGEALARAGTWLGDAKEETAEVFGFSSPLSSRGVMGAHMGGPVSDDLKDDEVWTLHYWEPDRYTVVANGTEAIHDGDNPFDDCEVPYFAANCFPIEFEFYGQGMLHPSAGLQEEMNAWRAIALDQGKLNMMKPIMYNPESGVRDEDFDIYPGQAIPGRFEAGKPPAVPLFPRDTLPPETYQMESMLLRDWQNALGINDYMVGGGDGNAGTASEAQMITAASSTRFKLQAFIGQKRYLERLAKKMFARRQQFLDEYEIFRILGPKGPEFPQLGPQDLAGEYDFIGMGALTGPNKEVERQQLIQFLTTASANPVMAGRLNWEELLSELVLKFDFRFPERFIQAPNKWSLNPQSLEKILQIAIENDDQGLVEYAVEELGKVEQMAAQMGAMGPQGGSGQNSGTMQQEVGGAGAQGAGQIAAGPASGAPNLGSMMAQAQGGPGI